MRVFLASAYRIYSKILEPAGFVLGAVLYILLWIIRACFITLYVLFQPLILPVIAFARCFFGSAPRFYRDRRIKKE